MTVGHREAASVRVPPVLVFAGAILLGALLQRTVMAWPLPLDSGFRLAGAATLGVAGLVPLLAALGLFKRTGQDPRPWKATPEIISSGVYARTRNPMYVGMALVQAAVGVGLANGWIVALVPAFLVVVYLTAIRHEEAYLETKFGDAYRQYRRSVRRWL